MILRMRTRRRPVSPALKWRGVPGAAHNTRHRRAVSGISTHHSHQDNQPRLDCF